MGDFSDEGMRETAITLAEMLLLDPLDEGEEPEIVEDLEYENTSVPEIEEATGLKHPEEYEIIEYSSGQRLIHDQLSGNLEENIPEDLEENSEQDFDLSKAQEALEEISGRFGGLMERL